MKARRTRRSRLRPLMKQSRPQRSTSRCSRRAKLAHGPAGMGERSSDLSRPCIRRGPIDYARERFEQWEIEYRACADQLLAIARRGIGLAAGLNDFSRAAGVQRLDVPYPRNSRENIVTIMPRRFDEQLKRWIVDPLADSDAREGFDAGHGAVRIVREVARAIQEIEAGRNSSSSSPAVTTFRGEMIGSAR